MKHGHILLFVSCLLLSLLSCKKDKTINYPLSGKWQQTELQIYDINNGKVAYDTTYYNPFTNLDYLQFIGDTATISSDHYYYINEPGYPKTPQLITPIVSKLGYKAIGNGKFVLNTTVMDDNFAGLIVNDTVIDINANKIQLHAVTYLHTPAYEEVSDSYYQR